MGQAYSQLNLQDRRRIDQLRNQNISINEIARILSRHRSTIYRELRRNRFDDAEWPDLSGYYSLTANNIACGRRKRFRKLSRYPDLQQAVVNQLKAGWSAEQVAGRLLVDKSPVRICAETIYRFAYSPEGQAIDLRRHFPEQRRKRRPRKARGVRGPNIPDNISIYHRPQDINERSVFGHWEGDLMMFQKQYGKANVMTLVERKSRFTALFKNNDRQSKPIMDAVINGLSPLPSSARRSFTFDRGSEFAAWPELKTGLGSETWFCDPHAPWQKGTVENTNRRLRRHLPRSFDPLKITGKYLHLICQTINTTPRKCLGFRTPEEVFRQLLLETG